LNSYYKWTVLLHHRSMNFVGHFPLVLPTQCWLRPWFIHQLRTLFTKSEKLGAVEFDLSPDEDFSCLNSLFLRRGSAKWKAAFLLTLLINGRLTCSLFRLRFATRDSQSAIRIRDVRSFTCELINHAYARLNDLAGN